MTPAMTKERRAEIESRHERHTPIIDAALTPEKLCQPDSINGPISVALHWANLDRQSLLTELTRRDSVEAELRALVEKLGEALGAVEYVPVPLKVAEYCPSCGRNDNTVHMQGCAINAALTDYHAFKAQSEGEKK